MVEEIVTGLSRIKWLFVISRNSTFIYKGRPVDVRTVGRELGVRYVLEGSVRRSGSQVRVTGQLSETETGAGVWADRYDGEIGEIFALQDLLTMRVIGAVEPTLRKAEIERARRKRPENIDAYDLFLRALPFAAPRCRKMPTERCVCSRRRSASSPTMPSSMVSSPGAMSNATCAAASTPKHERQLCAMHRPRSKRAAMMRMALAMGGFVIGVVERDYQTALDALDRSVVAEPIVGACVWLQFDHSSLDGR